MGPIPRDIVGQRFGRLRVTKRLPGSIALCVCDCGTVTKVGVGHLDKAKSCGCYRAEVRTKHGMVKRSEYGIWEHIVQRCTNPKDRSYANYGGRGISMHSEWRESFAAFFRDVGPRPSPQHTIDRIDNDGNYEPGNVRWVPKGAQLANTRATHYVTYQGKTMPIFKWAAELGISVNTVRTRLHRGWTPEQALSLSPQKGKKPE